MTTAAIVTGPGQPEALPPLAPVPRTSALLPWSATRSTVSAAGFARNTGQESADSGESPRRRLPGHAMPGAWEDMEPGRRVPC